MTPGILSKALAHLRMVKRIIVEQPRQPLYRFRTLLFDYVRLAGVDIVRAVATDAKRSRAGKFKINGKEFEFADWGWFVFLYIEIFIYRPYGLNLPVQQPKIIDCGANIGLSSLFFQFQFPGLSLLQFEPETTAFSILRRNFLSRGSSQVEAHECAVGSSEGVVSFFPGAEAASGISSAQGHELPTASSHHTKVKQTRLSNYITSNVDLIKIDIEGAEHDVLKDLDDAKKLSMISCLAIEYHHHMKPTEDKLSSFLGILERNGFGYQVCGGSNMGFGQSQTLMIYAYAKRLFEVTPV